MLTFKITSLKYFVKITKWIFLESTRKGLLKNVQDGISRPIGSREIHKAKPIGGFFESPFSMLHLPSLLRLVSFFSHSFVSLSYKIFMGCKTL